MSLVETVITYLEMRAPPAHPPVPAPREDLAVVRAVRPTVAYYRWLYERVGAPWLWVDRRRLDDAALARAIQDVAVEVHVLHVGGVPAGYVELDRRAPPDVELAYFGLMPEFLGQKLGPWLLDWAIREVWASRPAPARFWVHTQTLDDPRALPLYQRLGFTPYKEERVRLDIRLP